MCWLCGCENGKTKILGALGVFIVAIIILASIWAKTQHNSSSPTIPFPTMTPEFKNWFKNNK